MIGRTIGNYVVREKIGQGGMGAVYLAEHPRIGKQVAIKVLLPEFSRDAQVVGRFFNEARAANEIRNEHIIDIIDFGELAEDGASYIIMEWLTGRSLSSVLQEVGRMPTARAIHVTRGIARALSAAHGHGIVHRDLKPDNIFLITRNEDPDFVKVLDFGIAKLMGNQAANEIKTQTGAIIGTPSYMSPEQCRGLAIDQRTDIYALGVIVFEMLTGRLPFQAQGLGELLLQHMTQAPPPLREIDPTIPPMVEAAVLRALAKDPDERYQSCDQLMRALIDVQTGAHAVISASASMPAVSTAAMKAATPTIDTIGAASGQAVTTTQPPQARSRRGMLIAGGATVLAAAIAVGIVAFKPAPAPAPVAKPAVAPPPPAKPAPLPAPAQPTTAHVTIKAAPPDAQISLDGAKVPNPFDGNFQRNDVRHEIVVKAPGHRSESQWVTFEADRTVEVTLQKGSGTHESKKVALPTLPKAPDEKAATPAEKPTVAEKPAQKPVEKAAEKKPDDGKTIYKGTKAKILTDFPSE